MDRSWTGHGKVMERSWKGHGKVSFTRPFLILDKVTFDEKVNVLERYCKSAILYTFTKY